MTHKESPLEVTIKGALAGLAGTAVLTVVMKNTRAIMEKLGIQQPEPPRQGDGQEAAEPTEKLAEKVAEGILERPIDADTRQAAGQAIHWVYGTAWGAFYGIMQSSLRLPHWLHGTLFGSLIGAVAATLVPTMRLTPPPTEQPPVKNAMQFAYTLLYGWVTALVFRVLSRDAR